MNTDDIGILNSLIGATLASARHYRKLAGDIGNPRTRALLERLSTQRKQVAQTLQDHVAAVSGDPSVDAIPPARASRVFGDLRHAMSYGYSALIDEVERGEDHIKAKFECALENGKLSGLSRAVVQNAYDCVCDGCSQMHALKCYPNAEEHHSERLGQW
jgi:uncharacterized protein (TIGR02284 family)